MLLTDFGFFLSRKGNIKNYSRLLSFSKWDLYEGNASKAGGYSTIIPCFGPSPDDPDDVIKFKVGDAKARRIQLGRLVRRVICKEDLSNNDWNG